MHASTCELPLFMCSELEHELNSVSPEMVAGSNALGKMPCHVELTTAAMLMNRHHSFDRCVSDRRSISTVQSQSMANHGITPSYGVASFNGFGMLEAGCRSSSTESVSVLHIDAVAEQSSARTMAR